MILEGQTLLIVLIVVALAMAALGVYIRFGMKRASSDADIILSRFLGLGSKPGPGGKASAAVQEAPGNRAAVGRPGASMPSRSSAGTSANPAAAGAPSDKKGLLSGIGGGFGGLMGARKSKDQIKEEQKMIDSQLEQVLQLTEEISKTDNSMPPLTMPDLASGNAASPGMPMSMPESSPMSMPDSMPSLTLPDSSMPSLTMPDNSMPSLTLPDSMPSLTLPDNSMPSLTPPDNGLQLTLPDPEPAPAPAAVAPPAPPVYKSDGSATKKLCKEYVMPPEPTLPGEGGMQFGPGSSLGLDLDEKDKDKKDKNAKGKQKSGNTQDFSDFGGKKKDKKDDLLSDLEEEASKEMDVDMSIMKEYKDLVVTTDELENELKGVMDQINEKTGGKRDAKA